MDKLEAVLPVKTKFYGREDYIMESPIKSAVDLKVMLLKCDELKDIDRTFSIMDIEFPITNLGMYKAKLVENDNELQLKREYELKLWIIEDLKRERESDLFSSTEQEVHKEYVEVTNEWEYHTENFF